jgi:hypothetical protein
MTQTQPIVDPPPPRGIALMVATAVFNLLALILLVLGRITLGEVFVGLALVTGLVSIFRGGSSTPAGPAGNTTNRNTPTSAG